MYNNLLGRPEKKKIISRWRGYHGVSLGAASLSGLPSMHKAFDLPLPEIRHVKAPYRLWEATPGEDDAAFSARMAAELEELIVREGPGDRRGVHRRADPGRGRRDRPARRLLRGDPDRPAIVMTCC